MSEILEHLAKGPQEAAASVEAEAPATEEVTETAEATQEQDGGGYTIHGQTFKTQAEAFKYAESLALEKERVEAEANAYRQGIQEAALLREPAQNVTQEAPPEDDKFDEKFYSDPKTYLAERDAKVAAQVEQKILSQITQKSEDEKLWDEFFRAHPDLHGFREDCESTLTKHVKDIRALSQTKGKDAAMSFLAQKTRAKFQAYVEAAKPRRELSPSSVGSTPGQPTSVTRKTTEEQPLDFAAQIRSLRGKVR